MGNKETDNDPNHEYDWLIIKYAAGDGQRLWTRTFESAEGRSETCYDVVVDGLDNALVGGLQLDADGISHCRLERLNGDDGSVLAEQVWESDNNQILYGLAFRNRRIALCGAEHNGSDWDMRTQLGEPPPLEVAEVAKGEGETTTLDWSAAMGQVTIEYTPTLSPPDWQAITVPMSETSYTVEIPPGAPSGYYRLMEE
ncbi:hypothetical protein HQ563_11515 [bacterium]|nr:hypothetical protein [bacterium]